MGRLAPAVGITVALVALATLVGVFSSEPRTSSDTDSPIGEFLVREAVKPVTVEDQAGQPVALEQALAPKTLVTFWDATCGECVESLRLTSAFAAAHPDIKVLYVNVKNTREQVAEMLGAASLSLETFYDPSGAAHVAWSGTVPATYYIFSNEFRVFFPGRPSAEHLNALLTLE